MPQQGILSIALAIRLLMIASLGYIHPDEFFQSQEVMAGQVFDLDVKIPWEFDVVNGTLYRSYLPPFLVCGIPFQVMKILGLSATPVALLIVPRILLFISSLSMDITLSRVAEALLLDKGSLLFIFQTSWVSLLFSTRPFSNTLEMLILFATFDLVVTRTNAKWTPLMLGALVSFGCFVRITYPAFALPVGLFWIGRLYDWQCSARAAKSEDAKSSGSIARVVGISIIQSGCGFILWTVINVAFDSVWMARAMYPKASWTQALVLAIQNPVFAPVNNLLYNTQQSNLAEHGLHPRYNHALVNLQLLFGPLAALSLWRLATSPWKNRSTAWISAMWIVPTLLLSLFPHQEARFLIPLLLPLVISTAPGVNSSRMKDLVTSRPFRTSWLFFNSVLLAGFGLLHQGGVIHAVSLLPALLRKHDVNQHVCVVGSHIYMMPRFLLGSSAQPFTVQLEDAGSDVDALISLVSSPCGEGGKWWVVAPNSMSAQLKFELGKVGIESGQPGPVFAPWLPPHITTEHIPRNLKDWQNLGLELFPVNLN